MDRGGVSAQVSERSCRTELILSQGSAKATRALQQGVVEIREPVVT